MGQGLWIFHHLLVGISCHVASGSCRKQRQIACMPGKSRKIYRWDRIGLVLGGLALFSFGLAAWVAPEEEEEVGEILAHPNHIELPTPVAAIELQELEVTAVAKPELEEVVLPCSCNKKVLKLAKNPYTDHRRAARNLPNSFFVKDKNELNAGKRNGKLAEVKDGRGYHISALSHSYAVLLPEVKELLKDLGNDFADLLVGTPSEGTRIRVTSLTRTVKQQNRLGRRNYNAIDEASTHSYGASFDIAFTDRPDNEADCSAPTRAMQQVLSQYQKAKRILVIPERDCMHVTLRP